MNGAAGSRRQYGLLELQGGAGKITQRGLTVALLDEASLEYRRALTEAAAEPPLFAELHAEGKQDAAHNALLHHLVSKGFTSDGASRFIKAFKGTQALMSDVEGGKGGEEDGGVPVACPVSSDEETGQPLNGIAAGGGATSPDRTRVPLRLAGGYEAVIELPESMPESAWNHLIQLLDVMKAGYVSVPPSGEEPNAEE